MRLAEDRGADATVPRSTPLRIVSGAVAGDDLERVASAAAEALGCPVAIALPAIAQPTVWPPGSVAPEVLEGIVSAARDAIAGTAKDSPEQATVRIGSEIVGVVTAVGSAADSSAERRAWLDAAAAAAAVTALMRESHNGGTTEGSRRAFLQALCAGPPADVETFVAHARRLGFELAAGATAICARGAAQLPEIDTALLADLGGGRVLGLVPADRDAQATARLLADAGLQVAVSSPRKDPSALDEALREAEHLLELAASLHGQEETYRLLIGVLLRDPDELEALRNSTISSLVAYDKRHDTDLLATLQTFLAHHGSTTETAESMNLHRHTVGYRLSRVHEVSGLSPYESEGRERLSLGLKADQILAANQRLSNEGRLAPPPT